MSRRPDLRISIEEEHTDDYMIPLRDLQSIDWLSGLKDLLRQNDSKSRRQGDAPSTSTEQSGHTLNGPLDTAAISASHTPQARSIVIIDDNINERRLVQ